MHCWWKACPHGNPHNVAPILYDSRQIAHSVMNITPSGCCGAEQHALVSAVLTSDRDASDALDADSLGGSLAASSLLHASDDRNQLAESSSVTSSLAARVRRTLLLVVAVELGDVTGSASVSVESEGELALFADD